MNKATPKQKQYLRQLGCSMLDSELDALTVQEASRLIHKEKHGHIDNPRKPPRRTIPMMFAHEKRQRGLKVKPGDEVKPKKKRTAVERAKYKAKQQCHKAKRERQQSKPATIRQIALLRHLAASGFHCGHIGVDMSFYTANRAIKLALHEKARSGSMNQALDKRLDHVLSN